MGVTVPSGFPKQAIVVIHGMGEQKPMDTIKNFAHAVWTTDTEVHENGLRDSGELWSKPDDRTGSLELRRLTTRESTPMQEGTYPGGARQDFYELYWADLSRGSTLGDGSGRRSTRACSGSRWTRADGKERPGRPTGSGSRLSRACRRASPPECSDSRGAG